MASDGASNAVEMTLTRLRSLDARPAAAAGPAGTPARWPISTAITGCAWSGWPSCWSTTRSPREDVVQEAFTGLHRHWSGLRDEAAAVAYLRTAVVNGSRSVLRRRRTARDYIPPHQVNARSAESLAMLSAEHQAVVDALATLPPRQREVLVLRYYGGLSESEIADATGISRGTVKSTASRAMDTVARVMNPGGR